MSILKYILFVLVLFGLWVTEPMWRDIDTTTSESPASVHEPIIEQIKTKSQEVNVESRFLKELEIKIGPRPSVKESTGVPSLVYEYWRKILKYPDSLEEESCGPIRGSEEGWTTVCRYKVKNSSYTLELREERFVIRNGTVDKK